MYKKLDYYNLGSVNPTIETALWEYPRINPINEPTLFVCIPNKTAIKVTSNDYLEKVAYLESIPSEVSIVRIKNNIESTFISDSGLVVFYMHYPLMEEYRDFGKTIKDITASVLEKYRLPIEVENNDIFFMKDGYRKKFFGTMGRVMVDGWSAQVFSLTMSFNSTLANQIYRFDDEKFTKKGEVKDLGNYVGGLEEILPDIDKGELIAKIVEKITIQYNLILNPRTLSTQLGEQMESYGNNQ